MLCCFARLTQFATSCFPIPCPRNAVSTAKHCISASFCEYISMAAKPISCPATVAVNAYCSRPARASGVRGYKRCCSTNGFNNCWMSVRSSLVASRIMNCPSEWIMVSKTRKLNKRAYSLVMVRIYSMRFNFTFSRHRI